MKKLSKKERHKALVKAIEEDPFKTDQELANMFNVSIQTIRLDRMELRIPEVRKRTRKLAKEAYSKIKSMRDVDVIGDLVEVNLNKNGKSIFTPQPEMTFKGKDIVRGHYIFAHANSLAVAIIDANVAMTGFSHIKFIRPVRLGDRLVAKAHVVRSKNHRFFVRVYTHVGDQLVFKGKFIVYALDNHKFLKEN
ncbi:transcription factor FapR [Anoxybacter fermentans]|nr:transcription factor FapR [Anoxybacter fermentans]